MEVRLNNKVYIEAGKLVEFYPEAFKEGKKKPRQILQFKHIPLDHYIFGSCVKTGWRVSNETNNKAKLLITKEWVDQFMSSVVPPAPVEIPIARQVVEEVKDAPPVLGLADAEKFKDDKGKVLEIEVRGERDEDDCFFRVKDVATCFNDMSIYDNIPRPHTSYVLNEDYVYFYRPYDVRSIDNFDNKSTKRKELFFTYHGMLRYMFVSQNPNARAFRKWASRVLFAIQMGTTEQKECVASELLGVSVETVSKFLSACVRDIPMVYMLHLGSVPESIEVDGDRNDFLLFKIGQHGKEETKCGFKGRSKGHQQEFKEFRREMSYLQFVFLDPIYVSEAEKCIKDFFAGFRTNYRDKSEVYLIPKSKLVDVKKFFEHLSVIYSGNHADIQRSWDQFRNDTRTRIHDMEVENDHLREMIEQKEHHYKTLLETLTSKTQIIIDNLQDRVAEQANTIRAFISRLME